jgi:hypothetical protein
MKEHENNARKFMAVCKKNGTSCEMQTAQTGSIYITVLGFTFRFADHADAYGSAFYTCDGVEGNYSGAKKALLSLLPVKEDWEKRLEKIEKDYNKGKITAMERMAFRNAIFTE